MTQTEALKLALEALETSMYPQQKQLQAITAIKAALEAKDEPVATKNNDGVTLHLGWDDLPVGTKLYATPPQRTWVGLTDEDAQDVIKKALQSLTDDSNTFKLSGNMIWVAIVKEVEAALRSKNT